MLGRGDFGFANIDANDIAVATLAQVFCGGCCTLIIKAHPVQDGFIGLQTEEPRRRIAGLCLGGDGAQLCITKANRSPRISSCGVFIEPGGKSQRAGEFYTEDLLAQHWIVDRQDLCQGAVDGAGSLESAQDRIDDLVYPLRTELEHAAQCKLVGLGA